MKLELRLSLTVTSCLLLMPLTSGAQAPASGGAATWPTRVVTIIAPFAAGGPVDLEARIYAKKMGELTSQKVVVDYKPGAASSTRWDRGRRTSARRCVRRGSPVRRQRSGR